MTKIPNIRPALHPSNMSFIDQIYNKLTVLGYAHASLLLRPGHGTGNAIHFIMNIIQIMKLIMICGIVGAWVFGYPVMAHAQDPDSRMDFPESVPKDVPEGEPRGEPRGVYIELTKEFYESLMDGTRRGKYRYTTNDPSIEYLKEISISTRFMVETNLQILRQQEKIIELLQSLLKDTKK